MVSPIEVFMTEDHVRLDGLLTRASAHPDVIDAESYAEFRAGLLRHIAMEEKVLLPMARAKRGGEPLALAKELRSDHGHIAKLLVPTPTHAIVDELRELLGRHNRLEEGSEGLYAICDALAGSEADEIVERLRAQPAVPVAKHYDGPLLHRVR